MLSGPPERRVGRDGYPVWTDHGHRAEVRFVGRGPEASRAEVLTAATAGEGAPPAGPAAARQVHGAEVLRVSAEDDLHRGEGDALVTCEAGLALSVVTADCVPVLVEAAGCIAAIHAGWRGLVAGVIPRAAGDLRLTGAGEPATWIAWIGPTIGVCCYEVDEDVAARVAAASSSGVVARTGTRPHLDLVAAARHQLATEGVAEVRTMTACTRCETDLLWSYRREGRRAGRNHAFIWLRPA